MASVTIWSIPAAPPSFAPCRRLLGYALGRSIQLSDEPLIEEIMSQLKDHDYRFSVALETITLSPQFRMIRGTDAARTTAAAE